MLRRIAAVAVLGWLLGALAPGAARAQMELSLQRLRLEADGVNAPQDPWDGPCTPDLGGGRLRVACADETTWIHVANQFAAALVPPVLLPAHTRGPRGIHVGLETFVTGIDSTQAYWRNAIEGSSVDSAIAWNRVNVRKGLGLGFELGTNIGFALNTSYWTLGLEIRWSLLEGLRLPGSSAYLPSLSVRGAVQTMVGDSEFNVTVPAVDVTLGERFVVGNAVEISPYVGGQFSWVFVDSELVDLTPAADASASCAAYTGPPGQPNGPPSPYGEAPYCQGDGSDYNNNAVFRSVRSMRARAFGGLQLRYEWFALTTAFSIDVVQPSDLGGSGPSSSSYVPSTVARQWQFQLGLGVSY